MRCSNARVVLAIVALLTGALLLGVSALGLRAQAARPVEGAALEPAAPAEETRVYVDPVSSSVQVGETLALSIAIEGAEDIIAYTFDLSWDPAVFTFTDAADAGFLEGNLFGGFRLNPPGSPTGTVRVQMTVFEAQPSGASGDGVLATVTLQSTGGGTSTLDLHRVILTDKNSVNREPDVIDDGWAESACGPVTVTVEAGTPVELGQAMPFTATATGSEPISYTWGFGGPGTAVGGDTPTPSYLYQALGFYTATVTATNPCGVAQDAVPVQVTCDTAEISGLASDSPVQLGETTHFTASVAGAKPITTTWDFDDDGTPERVGVGLDLVTHTYTATGVYTARLTVDNPCAVEDWEVAAVQVVPMGTLARITELMAEEPAVAGRPVTLTATVTGTRPITYTWDVDSDGVAERVGIGLETVTHTYAAGGAYTVTLGVENAWSADSRRLGLDVCEPAAVTTLTSDGTVRVGRTMHFTAAVRGTEPITYSWDVDSDGAPEGLGSDLTSYSHVYTIPGTYTATLGVENTCGADIKLEAVTVEPYTVFLPLVLRQGDGGR